MKYYLWRKATSSSFSVEKKRRILGHYLFSLEEKGNSFERWERYMYASCFLQTEVYICAKGSIIQGSVEMTLFSELVFA